MPRRDPVARCKYPLYSCHPWFFWMSCSFCGREFRREKGWRAITGPYYNNMGRNRYLCSECAPTREEAVTYFNEDRWRPPRPAAPPPQPPPVPSRAIEEVSREVERQRQEDVHMIREERTRYESLEIEQ